MTVVQVSVFLRSRVMQNAQLCWSVDVCIMLTRDVG